MLQKGRVLAMQQKLVVDVVAEGVGRRHENHRATSRTKGLVTKMSRKLKAPQSTERESRRDSESRIMSPTRF